MTAPVTPTVLDPAGRDLHAENDRLRAAHPCAALLELPGGIRAWAPTSYDVLKGLLADARVSKDPDQHWPEWIAGEHRQSWIVNWVGVSNMFNAYGADHRRLRTLIAPAFTRRRTDVLRPRIEQIAGELLDAMAAAPDGRADLRSAYAHPLPMQVICELFGVPEAQRADAARLVAGIMDTTVTPEQAQAILQEVHQLLGALVEAKRAQPGDDLTSALIATRDDAGSGLTEQELIDTLLLVIGAGHETTVNLVGNAAHALLTHPDQLARVRSGEIPWSEVIEETLRWAPSIANLPLRYAVEDIDLPDGTRIAAGEAILASYAAAGRDPRRHGPDADRFDIARADKEHLAFGHGVHFCLGAPLARLEAAIALPALFDRFPGLALEDGATHVESFIGYGYGSLPVRLK